MSTQRDSSRPQINGDVPHTLSVGDALCSDDLCIRAMGRILDLLTWLAPMHIAVFYTVDEAGEKYARGPIVAKISDAFPLTVDDGLRLYSQDHAARDPFAPCRLPDYGMTLATPRDVPGASWYAQQLATRFNLRPVANMYFHDGDRIVAGISLVRELDAPQLAPSEIAALRQSHACFELLYVLSARLSETLDGADGLDQGSLTAREREVFTLITRGASNDAIANILGISRATVKTHVKHTFAKLGIADRHQAMVALLNSARLRAVEGELRDSDVVDGR